MSNKCELFEGICKNEGRWRGQMLRCKFKIEKEKCFSFSGIGAAGVLARSLFFNLCPRTAGAYPNADVIHGILSLNFIDL